VIAGRRPGYVDGMASTGKGPLGSFDRPASALNLRFVLAVFGLVNCAVGAVIAAIADLPWVAVVLGALAMVAAIDLVVIQRRKKARGRGGYSLFE
jgi:hypothetical protein